MPLLLSLAIFFTFAGCGRAAFCLLGVRLGHARTWLLAPALGLAVVGLMVMLLNQAGLPVATFARSLTAGTLLGTGWILYRGRMRVPRALVPFGAIALFSLLLGGWPALVHGFGWVAYGNDDMTNYCLAADRFLHYGFYHLPTLADLAGRDQSQYYWLMMVGGFIRFGSEHLIAFVAGVTGLSTLQVFMPVILGLALTQLWAVMALVYTCPRRRIPALMAGVILAVAPLWYYGTMYQLIAQVAGLALLLAALAFTARAHFPRRLAAQLRLAVVCALLISGLAIYYPEVIPFYVIGWGLYMVLRPRLLHHEFRRLLSTIGLAVVCVFILLRHNVHSAVFTLYGQAVYGLTPFHSQNVLFPYFLIPVGPAYFFGFDVIVLRYLGPWATPALIAGFVTLAIVVCLWIRGLRERAVSATVLAGMVVTGVKLFTNDNGFGLFKLALFALPFVAIELARLFEIKRARPFILGAFLLLLPVWIAGAVRYAQASLANATSLVDEVFDASASLGRLPAAAAAPVWSDIVSAPVAKLLMITGAPLHSSFISQLYFAGFMGIANQPKAGWTYRMLPGLEVTDVTATRFVRYIESQVYPAGKAAGLTFLRLAATDTAPVDPATILVTSRGEVRSFNKLSGEEFEGMQGLFDYAPISRLENHLAFIWSSQGQHYYLGEAGYISVYKPEPDSYARKNYFFVIGRHLLFRVINPTETVRLRLSLTDSILGEGRTRLPDQATVIGGSSAPTRLNIVGAGSANVFSPPLRPLSLNGAAYVAMDLGRASVPIGLPASGLQGIYRRNLPLDTRLGVGYCRDISLLSEPRYALLPRHQKIDRFPTDLVGPDAVEYSGLYEDGWVSQRAFVMLGAVTPGDKVVVTGMRPQIPGAKMIRQRVELSVDGVRLLSQELPPGDFTLEAPLGRAAPQVKIELHFDYDEALPAPDNRPVTVLLESIKITPSP